MASADRVFGLSVLKVAQAGAQPLWPGETATPLGPATALHREDGSVASLLARVEISDELEVTPIVPGVANMTGVIDPVDALDMPVMLATAPTLRLGCIISLGKTVAFRTREGRAYYSDAVEIGLGEGGRGAAGTAGALVCTQKGEALGIVIGSTETSLYTAPLYDLLEHNELEPLTWAMASRHNAQVEQCLALRQEAAAARAARQAAAGRSDNVQHWQPRHTSTDIYARYNPARLIRLATRPSALQI